MNYIVEIADLLGVGLYKNFTIEGFEDTDFKLTANGLFYYDNRTFTWEKSLLLDDILIGTRKIIKSILTEKEKEYLSSVIEPYRDDVVCIIKSDVFEHPRVYIHLKHDIFGLPWFEKDTMYKGMEFEKRYSLEDLGL